MRVDLVHRKTDRRLMLIAVQWIESAGEEAVFFLNLGPGYHFGLGHVSWPVQPVFELTNPVWRRV
jgi:hypothetical protein